MKIQTKKILASTLAAAIIVTSAGFAVAAPANTNSTDENPAANASGGCPGMQSMHNGHGDMEGKGQGGCGMMGMNAPKLTKEQQELFDKLSEDFRKDVTPIKQELRAKRAELNAFMKAVTPDTKKIETASRELGEIEGRLNAKVALFDAALQKEGIFADHGQGMGMGHGKMQGGHGKMAHGNASMPAQGGHGSHGNK